MHYYIRTSLWHNNDVTWWPWTNEKSSHDKEFLNQDKMSDILIRSARMPFPRVKGNIPVQWKIYSNIFKSHFPLTMLQMILNPCPAKLGLILFWKHCRSRSPATWLGSTLFPTLNIHFWFGLMFYVPVNSYGHVGTVSSRRHTFFLGKLD